MKPTCDKCGKKFPDNRALGPHRFRCKGGNGANAAHRAAATPESTGDGECVIRVGMFEFKNRFGSLTDLKAIIAQFEDKVLQAQAMLPLAFLGGGQPEVVSPASIPKTNRDKLRKRPRRSVRPPPEKSRLKTAPTNSADPVHTQIVDDDPNDLACPKCGKKFKINGACKRTHVANCSGAAKPEAHASATGSRKSAKVKKIVVIGLPIGQRQPVKDAAGAMPIHFALDGPAAHEEIADCSRAVILEHATADWHVLVSNFFRKGQIDLVENVGDCIRVVERLAA